MSFCLFWDAGILIQASHLLDKCSIIGAMFSAPFFKPLIFTSNMYTSIATSMRWHSSPIKMNVFEILPILEEVKDNFHGKKIPKKVY